MNIWRIEIERREGFNDPHAQAVLHELADFGIATVRNLLHRRIFLIGADIDRAQMEQLTQELLVDGANERAKIDLNAPPIKDGDDGRTIIEVHLRPGVMDPVAISTLQAIEKLGLPVRDVRTARMYIFEGDLSDQQKALIGSRILANDCIEQLVLGSAGSMPSPELPEYTLDVRRVPIRELSNEDLLDLSRRSDLFLNVLEMRAIQEYFRRMGREPTDIELETLAQTWSEHCVHKTFKSDIDYTGPEGRRRIKNLFKSTIVKATKELARPWCISVFKDNAGIIEFDETQAVCFKVETHNHPSAIEPYGGAATGIGGVVRDPLGTGLGAKPIANTDVFCFARPDFKLEDLPAGVLHPRKVFKGVVSGVRDYGNRMGIPTVNGAIWFDNRYLGNPLVYCGNVGLIPKDKCFGEARTGDWVVVVGGRTGRDGIHGATFSSGELTDRSDEEFSHAVQIGNAITEKKMADVILQARDWPAGPLYHAITDCGAGGLSSAIGEMGADIGAEIDLEKVPLKYHGLRYDEIWISEAQERMVLAVSPENWPTLKSIFDAEDIEATAIGVFADHKQLVLRYEGTQVGELEMNFLHEGVPQPVKKATWQPKSYPEPTDSAADPGAMLHRLLGQYNIASKEWVIRQYDHEVQGGSVIKPLLGVANDGPSDAAVIRPVLGSDRGLAIGCGLNPNFGEIDPYWMAACCIDEAVRNVVAVGGDPSRCAILDNFCWGNCDDPEKMGALVRAAQGCLAAAKGLRVPFISGKDSLNNEFVTEQGERIAIPGTLLISAIAIVPDVTRCVTMDLKQPGNLIYLIGSTQPELGGSHYWSILGYLGNSVPQVDLKLARRIYQVTHRLIAAKLLRSCHDCSEGGLGVALAEMAFSGGWGMNIDLGGLAAASGIGLDRPDWLLFSESTSRFVVEVRPEDEKRFLAMISPVPTCKLGHITELGQVCILGSGGRQIVCETIEALKTSWKTPIAY
jgi:phosphoribosylformylglycinamidine synthase